MSAMPKPALTAREAATESASTVIGFMRVGTFATLLVSSALPNTRLGFPTVTGIIQQFTSARPARERWWKGAIAARASTLPLVQAPLGPRMSIRPKALNHISSLGTARHSWLIYGVDPIAKPPHHEQLSPGD